MQRNRLEGPLSIDGAIFSSLRKLNVNNNRLVGTLAPHLVRTLDTLHASMNSLSGTLPAELSHSLNHFDAGYNRMSGTIAFSSPLPPFLVSFLAAHNALSGTLPLDLYHLPTFGILSLHSNRLSGTISPMIGQLRPLMYLDLDRNQLSGTLPRSIATLQFLQKLFVSHNERLSGTIPAGVLVHNRCSGTLPALYDISGARSMVGLARGLRLDHNRMSGTIPLGLASCINLQHARLQNAAFSGTIPDLSSLSRLQSFLAQENQLSGTIPTTSYKPWHGDEFMLPDDKGLKVHRNKLSGTLSAAVVGNPAFWVVDVHRNRLSGTLPTLSNNLTADPAHLLKLNVRCCPSPCSCP